MKRIVLGDIHGHLKYVRDILEKENPDEVILLGDYFDSFVISPEDQIECFKELCNLQDKYGKSKFHMIIGNHDFHYFAIGERYSGWNYQFAAAYRALLKDALKEERLQYIYIDHNTIYSHAGITGGWLKDRCLIDYLQDVNKFPEKNFYFTSYKGDCFGSSPLSSCIWVRPTTLCENPIAGFNQVVGHTHTNIPMIEEVNGNMFYFIDCLPNGYIVEEINGDALERKVVEANVLINNLQ